MFDRSRSRRSFLKAAGGVSIAGGLTALSVGCGSDDDDDAGSPSVEPTRPGVTGQPTAAADIKLAAVQKLTVRQYDEPGSLDPAVIFRIEAENIATNIYSGLTAFDPLTGAPIPSLAKEWKVSPDGKSYTFNLVENAFFHEDFGKFTSADVKYSYERILDPATKSTYRAEFNNILNIETPNEYTVVINLKTPDANFAYQVGNYHQGEIVKKEAVQKYGDDFRRHPIGTGPFYLKEWVANSHMLLQGHSGHFRGKPTLEEIRLNLIKDTAAAETALNNNEVSVAMSIGRNTEIIDRLNKSGKFTLHKSEDYANNLWIFQPDYAPLADVRVRQAFAYGTDSAAISKALTPYTAKPSDSILPPFMPEYAKGLPQYGYDPKKAKDLLQQAGFGSGLAVKQILTSTTGASDDLLYRQAQLAEVGINMEFELMETAIWNTRRNGGDYQMTGRLYPAVNPDTLLFGYLHPDNIVPKGLNGAKYNNPALTTKLEAARAELNTEKRMALYKEVQTIAMTDLPYIPMATSTVYWAAYPWIKGLVIDKLAAVDYFNVKIEEHA